MSASYTAIGHDSQQQHGLGGNSSYEPYRQSAQSQEKKTRRVSFQIPENVSASVQGLSSKLRHKHSYEQLPEGSKRFWNPVWLSGPSFLLFAIWYMLLVLATAALYLFSTRNSGISGESYAHRYSWTYGPTAVLVLTISLWYHVEFWCKELTPWARMRRSATASSHGLLRDYLTKWPLLVIWRAIRDGDHAVWLATLGTLLLHLSTILSTSIIVLEPASVSSPLKLSLTESFMSSPPNISLQALSGNALIRYFGVQSRNLTYPVGTSANLAITSFLPPNGYEANSTFTATVPGMAASLDCEPIHFTNLTGVTSWPWRSILAPVFTTNISIPSCDIIGVPIGMGISHDPPVVNTVSSFQGWWNNYTCNDGVDNSRYPEISMPPYPFKPIVPGFDDHRLVFITSFIQWTGRESANVSRHTWVQNFTGVVCKPKYSMDYYDVNLSPQNLHTKQPYQAQLQRGTSRKISGFSDIDLAALIKRDAAASLIVGSALRQTAIAIVDADRGYLPTEDPFFVVMSGDGNIAVLSNQTEMLKRVPETFSGVSAQAFQEYLIQPENREIDGTVQQYRNRLKAKAVPVGLIIGFLSILIIISISLIFLSPWNCVSSDPHSIAAKAKFLAASPALSYHLRGLNGLNMHQVQSRLETRSYKTIIGPEHREFVIVPENEFVDSGSVSNDRSLPPQGSNVWWRPLNHRFWYILAIVFAPLAVIAVLEMLQHLSNSHEGIRDVADIGTYRILVTLIPATVLSLIALNFQGMHLNACLTAPFNALKHGGASHSRGLTVSLLGKTSPHVLVLGLKNRLLLPCMTALCVMVGAFLTIVVSGLYYIQDVPLVQQVTLQKLDVFNFTARDLSLSDNLAGATTKLLFRENLTDPPMTYQNLVFPAVSIADLPSWSNSSSIDVQLPAIRPVLKCFSNDPGDIVYDEITTWYNGSQPRASYETSFNFLCPSNSSTCSKSWSFEQVIQTNASNFVIGYAEEFTTIGCPGQEDISSYVEQKGCPSIIFGLGNTSFAPLNQTAARQTKPSLHAFICYGHLEEVQTKLTLLLPEYAISKAAGKTPIIMESTVKNLTFSSSSYDGPIYTNALSTLLSVFEGGLVQVGPLIDVIIQGKDNFTAADILASDVSAILQAHANDLYSTYMVNAISANFRVSPAQFNDQDSSQSQPADILPGTTYSGVLTQTNRQRLKQDANTKIALQVMLGVMTLFAITVYLLTDRKLRLPTNPVSIAGTMLLLAGSEMASRKIVPESSEWSNDTRLWEGWLFSLGWWSDGQGKRFGIDIGNASTGVTGAIGSVAGDGGGDGTDPHNTHGHSYLSTMSDKTSTRAYTTTLEPEEHELRHLQPFSPVIVDVPSGEMGWEDNYRFSLTKPFAGSYTSGRMLQLQPQPQQHELDAGDIGVAQTRRSVGPEFERMYDKYRSRVAKQYQMSR